MRAVGAVLAGASPRLAAAGAELRLRPEAGEVAQSRVGSEDDVAAAAAVAAVGTALRHVLLAPEAQAAVAAAARLHLDAGAIVEQGRLAYCCGCSEASATETKRFSPLGGTRPCPRAWRRSCRRGRCRCRGRGGTSCRAGGRGSCRPSPSGRRRSSRRGASRSSRGRSGRSRDLSCVPSSSPSPRVPLRARRSRPFAWRGPARTPARPRASAASSRMTAPSPRQRSDPRSRPASP